MKRLAIYADVNSLYYCLGKKYNKKLDYKKYLEFVRAQDVVIKALAYTDQDSPKFLDYLRHAGFTPRKADLVQSVLDFVRIIPKVDILILGSSDPALIPLIQWTVEQNVDCVIVSCGIPKEMRVTEYLEIPEEVCTT